MKKIIKYLAIIGAVASYIGVLFYLVINNNDKYIIITLLLLCLFLVIVILLLIWGIFAFFHKEFKKGFTTPSIFVSYNKKDSSDIVYEVFKVIQSKRLKLNKYTQIFKWSMGNLPKVSSILQEPGKIRVGKNGNSDEVDLYFQSPLRFNEIATVHFKAEMKDPDCLSSPHVELRVEESIRYIDFRISLLTMPDDYSSYAKVSKRPLSASNDLSQSIEIAQVPFSKETKTYQYHIPEPESHCFYRIDWNWK